MLLFRERSLSFGDRLINWVSTVSDRFTHQVNLFLLLVIDDIFYNSTFIRAIQKINALTSCLKTNFIP